MDGMVEARDRLLHGIAELARQTDDGVVRVGLLVVEVNLSSDEVLAQLEQLDSQRLIRFTRGHAGDDVVVLLPAGHAAIANDPTASKLS